MVNPNVFSQNPEFVKVAKLGVAALVGVIN